MTNILSKEKVILNAQASSKSEAIRMAGNLLVKAGHVSEDYVDKMLEREEIASTYMGGGLAIPHGTKEAKGMVASTGLSIVRFPEGVDFGGDEPAFIVIGIAAAGGDHMEILTNVAMIFTDDESIEKVMNASTEEEILAIFEGEWAHEGGPFRSRQHRARVYRTSSVSSRLRGLLRRCERRAGIRAESTRGVSGDACQRRSGDDGGQGHHCAEQRLGAKRLRGQLRKPIL